MHVMYALIRMRHQTACEQPGSEASCKYELVNAILSTVIPLQLCKMLVYAIYMPSFLLGAVVRRTKTGRATGTIRVCVNIVTFHDCLDFIMRV